MAKDIQPLFSKKIPFEVYRYQLVVDKAIQLSLDNQFQSPEEIREHKNKIFQELISNKRFKFSSSKSQLNSELVHTKGDISIFRIAVKRRLKHELPDFGEEIIDNYPKFFIAINNNKDVQKIAIQHNLKAFSKVTSASRIIEESIQNKIRRQNLAFYLEPLFNKQQFWELIQKYRGRVKQLSFDLITPNLAKISKNLKFDLKKIYEDTNTHKTTLEFNSDKKSHLEINEASEFIKSIVDYSAEGGGNIAIKVAGYHNKFHTSDSIQTFDVDEQLLKNNDWDALDQAFRDILL